MYTKSLSMSLSKIVLGASQKSLQADAMRELSWAKSITMLFRLSPSVD